MDKFRYAGIYRLVSYSLTYVTSFILILFGVTLTPIYAKKVESLEKVVTSPVRIALTHEGDLLLSDYRSQSVLIIDATTFGVTGIIKIKGLPTGVNGDGERIYVGNEATGNVEIYNKSGKLQAAWGAGQISLPNDIEVDHATGQVFVVDTRAQRIRVFDAGGQEVGSIPAPGVTETLYNPTALAIDQDNHLVYVSDQGPSVNSLSFRNRNALVRIYRYDGSYVDTLSGAFSRPQGLTVNKDGYLYLVDGMLGQIMVFDLLSKGLVKTLGTPGTEPGQLSLPLDVVINPDSGDLLVTNNRAGRLEVFPRGGVAP